MKTYRSKQTGVFVGRQADQVESEDYEVVEVPTAKDDLIQFINELAPASEPAEAAEPVTAPEPAGWLRTWQAEKAEQGAEWDLALELDEAIMRAPLPKAMRLAELAYGRLSEFKK